MIAVGLVMTAFADPVKDPSLSDGEQEIQLTMRFRNFQRMKNPNVAGKADQNNGVVQMSRSRSTESYWCCGTPLNCDCCQGQIVCCCWTW